MKFFLFRKTLLRQNLRQQANYGRHLTTNLVTNWCDVLFENGYLGTHIGLPITQALEEISSKANKRTESVKRKQSKENAHLEAKREALALLLATDFVHFITGEEQAKFRAVIQRCDPKLIYPDRKEKNERREKEESAQSNLAAEGIKAALSPSRRQCPHCNAEQACILDRCVLCGEMMPTTHREEQQRMSTGAYAAQWKAARTRAPDDIAPSPVRQRAQKLAAHHPVSTTYPPAVMVQATEARSESDPAVNSNEISTRSEKVPVYALVSPPLPESICAGDTLPAFAVQLFAEDNTVVLVEHIRVIFTLHGGDDVFIEAVGVLDAETQSVKVPKTSVRYAACMNGIPLILFSVSVLEGVAASGNIRDLPSGT